MDKKNARAVIVRNAEEAIAACRAAAAFRRPLLAMSPPGAASFAGPLWFKALAAAARRDAATPGDVLFVLDCADAPGAALAAIHARVEAISCGMRGTVRAKIRAIAARAGVIVLDPPRKTLDLSLNPEPNTLADWFSSRGASLQRPRRSAKRTATRTPAPKRPRSGARRS
jgi:hypothetical protein